MQGGVLPIALLPMLLTPSTVRTDDTSDWYGGDIGQVPDYHLFPRRPLNAVGMPLAFSCSAATLGPLRFRWRVAHPDRVNVSISSSSRSIFVDRGRGVYVRDSVLELRSSVPHEGKVKCKLLDPEDILLADMMADYKVINSVSLKDCDDYPYCHRDRSSCLVDDKNGLDCRCKSQYPYRDDYHGVCFSGLSLGDACVFDYECYAKVNNSWCQDAVCACRPLYTSDGPACVLMVKLGDPCGDEARCSTFAAACIDGNCRCMTGFEDVDGICLQEQVTSSTTLPSNTRLKLFKAFPRDETTVTSVLLLLLIVAMIALYHVMLGMHYKKMITQQLRGSELTARSRTE